MGCAVVLMWSASKLQDKYQLSNRRVSHMTVKRNELPSLIPETGLVNVAQPCPQ